MKIIEDDLNFIAPICAKGGYIINNILICGAGAIACFIGVTSYDSIWLKLFAIVVSIFGTIAALVINRIALECILLFFEYLKIMKQIRDGQDVIMETMRAILIVIKSKTKNGSNLNMAGRSSVYSVSDACKKGRPISREVCQCPSCGKEVVLPNDVMTGQNILCPYCDNKFQI